LIQFKSQAFYFPLGIQKDFGGWFPELSLIMKNTLCGLMKMEQTWICELRGHG